MDINFCYIKEQFFLDHGDYVKMLDPGNTDKQSKRTHLCITLSLEGNTFYIPLRNRLGGEVKKFGRIGHAVPSASRPDAGLDYRYTLVINDSSYIEPQTSQKLPNSQCARIATDYSTIVSEFETYINGYKKAAKKNRVDREPLYRESSLINFHAELGL